MQTARSGLGLGTLARAVMVLATVSGAAHAQDRDWNTNTATDWDTAAAWTGTNVPDSPAESARFSAAGNNGDCTLTVAKTGANAVGRVIDLDAGDYTGTLTLDADLTTDDTGSENGEFSVNDTTTGTMKVVVNATRTLSVSGNFVFTNTQAGSTFTNNGTLTFVGTSNASVTTKAGVNLGNVVLNKATGADVLTLGSDITCTNLTITQGTLNLATFDLTVTGTITIDGGAIVAGDNPTTPTVTAANLVINGGNYNLGNDLQADTTLSGNFTLAGGTYTEGNDVGIALTVAGNFSFTSGTWTNANGIVIFNGAGVQQLATSASIGEIQLTSTSTLTLTGAATATTITATGGTTKTIDLATFTLNATVLTVANTAANVLQVTGNATTGILALSGTPVIGGATGGQLTIQGGIVDLNAAFTGAGQGTISQTGGTFRCSAAVDLSVLGGNYTATGGTLELDGAAQNLTVGGGSGVDTLFNVTCNGTADATVVAGASSFRVDGTLTLNTKGLTMGVSTGLLDLRATGTAVSIGSGTTLNLGTVSSADIAGSVVFGATGTWNANSRAVTLAGDFDASAGGTLSNPGAFTFDDAAGTQTITISANADTFAAITVNRGADAASTVLAGTGTLSATSLSINRGDFDVGTCSLDVSGAIAVGDNAGNATSSLLTNRAGGIQVGGGLTRNPTDGDFVAAAGTLTFDGAGSWTSTTDDNFGDVVVSAAVAIPAGSTVSVNTLDVSASGLTLNATGTLEVEGTAATPVTLTGTLSGGTVVYRTNNGAGNVTIATASYTNLTLNQTGETFVLGGTTTVSGVCAVDAGQLALGSNQNLNLTGSAANLLTLTGTLDGGTGTSTVNYQPSSGTAFNVAASTGYNNLTVNRTGGTFTLAGTTTVGGALAITNGILSSGQTLTVTGATSVAGTLTITGSAATLGGLSGAGTLSVSGGSISPGGFTMTGTVNHTSGTITFNDAALNLGALTGGYNGSGTAVTTLSAAAGMALTSGASVTFQAVNVNTSTVTVSGARFAANGLVTLNAALVLGPGSSTMGSLDIDAAADDLTLGTGSLTVGTVADFAAGTITLNGQTLNVTTGLTWTTGLVDDSDSATSILDLDVSLSPSGGTLDMSNGTLRVAGATVNVNALTTATFGATSLLVLDASTATGTQTVTLKNASPNLGRLTLQRQAGTDVCQFATNAPVIAGTTTLTSGRLNSTLSGATFQGAVTVASGSELRAVTASTTTSFQSTVDVAGTLRFGDAATSNIVVQFAGGSGNRVALSSGGQFVVAGDLGGGANNNRRVFLSQDGTSGGAQWFLDYNAGGTVSVSRARIQDGNASPGGTLASGGSSLDGANNTGWVLSANTLTWDNGNGTNVWSDAANWAEDATPVNGDTVTFAAVGGTSTVDIAGLTLAAMDMTNFTGTLTQNQALNVSGAVTVVGTAYTMNAGLTVGGAFRIASGTLTTNANTLALNGTCEVDGALAISGTGAVTLANDFLVGSTGTVNGTGALNLNGATSDFTACAVSLTGGTTTLGRNGAQTVNVSNNDSFSGVTVNKAAGAASIGGAGPLDINGTLTLTAGNLTLTGSCAIDVATSVAVTNGLTLTLVSATNVFQGSLTVPGTLTLAGGTLRVGGDFDLTGRDGFTVGGTTLELNGPLSPQSVTLAGDALGAVAVSKLAGTANFLDAVTCTTLTKTNGGSMAFAAALTATSLTASGGGGVTLANATNDLNGSVAVSGTTSLTLLGGTLTVAGDWNLTGASAFSPNGTVVRFDGGGAQAITPNGLAFGTLQISKSGTATVSGALSCTSLAVQAGTLSAGSTVAVTAGDLTVSGTAYSATGATTITGNLTISAGSATLGNASNSVTGNMTLSGGSLVGNATAGSLSVGGDWNTTGTTTFTPNAMVVVFDGGAGQAIVPTNDAFGALTINKTGTATVTGSLTANGQLQVTGGTLSAAAVTVSTGGLTVNGGTYTASGLTTVTAGGLSITSGSFSGAAVTVSAGGLSVSGGSYAATGATAVTGALAVSNAGVTCTLANATNTVSTDVTISTSGTLQGAGGGGSLQFGGNWTGTSATFTPNGLTVIANSGAGQTITQGSPFANLTKQGAGTASVANLNATGTILVSGGTLQPSNAVTGVAAITVNGGTFSNNGQALTPSGAVTITSGTFRVTGSTVSIGTHSGAGTLDVTGGTLTFTAALNLTGTITHSAGTVNFLAASTVDLAALTSGYAGSGSATAVVSGGTLAVDNQVTFLNLTVQTSAVVMTGSTAGLTVNGTLALNAALTLTGGSSTVGTLTGAGALAMSGLNVTVSGTFTHTGTITTGAGTLQLDGAEASVALDGTILATGGVVILTNGVTGVDVGTLTIGSGNLRVGGSSVTFSGFGANLTFTTGTLTFIGSASQTPNLTGVTLANLALEKAATGNLVNFGANAVNVGGTTTLTTGTLNLTASRTFTGAVTIGAGGVLSSSTASITATFGSTVATAGAVSFTANAQVVSFAAGAGGQLTQTAGTFTVSGGGGANRIRLEQDGTSGGTQWLFVVSGGTVSVTNARIQDGNVSPGQAAASSVNNGNNTGWTFGVKTTNFSSTTGGNWSVDANWDNDAPTAGDTVGFTGTSAGTSVQDIAGLSLAAVSMTGFGGTLRLDQNLTTTGDFLATSSLVGGGVTLNTGDLTVGGNLRVAAQTLDTNTRTLVVNGTTEIDGTLTVDSGGVADLNGDYLVGSTGAVNGAGALQLGGATVNLSASSLSMTGGTTSFDRAGAQTLVLAGANDTFFAMTVGSSGLAMTGSTAGLDVDGALTLNGGLTLVGGTADVAGALTINAGTLATNDLSLAVGGVTTVGGTLNVSGTGDTVTLTGGVAGAGTITHSGSTIAVPSATVDLTSLASYAGSTPATFQLTGAAAQTLVVDAGVTFFNLTVGAQGAAMTGSTAGLNVDGALLCNGGLTLAGGAADVAGTLTTTAGTLAMNNQNLTVAGVTGLAGNLTTGTGTLTINNTLDLDGTLTVGTGGTLDLNGNFLAASTGTLAGTGSVNLSGTTLNFVTATVSLTGGTTTLDGAAATLVVGAPADSFFNLTIGANGAVMTGSTAGLAVANDLACNGNLTLLGGNATVGGALTVAGTRTLATNDLGLTVTGLTTITGILSVSGTGDIVALNGGLTGAGTVNQSGDTIQVPTATVDLSTLTAFNGTGGTFQLTGIVAQTLVVDAGVTFFNLTVNAAGATMTGSSAGLNVDGALTLSGGLTLAGGTATVAGATSIAGTLTLNGQNLDAEGLVSGAGTLNATGASNVNVAGGLTVTTYTAGSGTLTFDGTGTWSNGGGSFGTVVVSTGTVSLGTNVSAASLNVTGGALAATTFTFTCSGNLTVTGNGFTATTGGVTFNGTTATWSGAGVASFGAVTVTGTGAVTAAGATLVTGALTVQTGGSLTATATDLTCRGNVSLVGALNNTGRTLTLGATGAQTFDRGANGGTVINNLATASTAVASIVTSPLTIAGTVVVANGTTLRTQAATTCNGTTAVDGTLDCQADTSFVGTVTVTNGHTLSATAVTLRWAFFSSLVVNTGGTVSCNGTSLRAIGTDSAGVVPDPRWNVALAAGANQTFLNVNVQNSNGAGGALVANATGTSSDLGYNIPWTGLTAVDVTWLGAGSPNDRWDVAANWLGGVLPFNGCNVVFDGTQIGYVSGTAPRTWVGTQVVSFASLVTRNAFNGSIRLGNQATSFTSAFTHQVGGFDANGNTLRLNGTATINVALLNAPLVQFGGAGAQTLSSTLNPLTFTALQVGVSTAANVTVITANPIQVNGAFTVEAAATFDTGAGDVALDLNGAATIAGGLVAQTSAVTCAGAWDSTGAGVVSFSGAGSLTFDGAAAQTVSVGATDVLQSVLASNAAGVTQGATSASWDVNGDLTVTAGSLTLASTGGADVEGLVGVTGGGAAGGLDINGATVTVGGGVNAGFTTPGGRVTDTAGTGTVTLEPGAAADSLGGAFPITVGNLTIGGPTAGGRSSMQTAAADVTVLQTLTVSASRILRGGSAVGALRARDWTLAGTYEDGAQATFVAGDLTVTGGTWTDNTTGLLTFNGPTTGTQTLSANGASLGNARVNNGAGTVTTVSLANAATFTALDLNGNDVMNPNGQTLTISGNGTATPFTIAAAANLASGVGAGTVRFTSVVAVTLPAVTFRDLTLDSAVTYTPAGPIVVNGTLLLNAAGTTYSCGQNLTAGAISGTGSLTITSSIIVTLTTGTIATTVTVLGAATADLIQFQTPVTIPNLAAPNNYGDLTLNGGSFSVAGGSLTFQGALTLTGGAFLAPGAVNVNVVGGGNSSIVAGTAAQSFASLTITKASFNLLVTLSATGGAARAITGPVTISTGTLSVAASWQFLDDTTVGQPTVSPQDAQLRVQTAGVNLQLGDGPGDTVVVHPGDTLSIGTGAVSSLQLTLGNGTTIALTTAQSILSLAGNPADPQKLRITTTSGSAFITSPTNGNITASNVAVANNNASGVLGGPILATNSEDGVGASGPGTNVNWSFVGGGTLSIIGATALGDGTGRINRVRVTYSTELNTATLGTNYLAFGLKLGTGTPVVGTAINLVPAANDDTVDITFGSGVATTSVGNLQLVYTAPSSNRITSTLGVSANQNQTLDGSTTTPVIFDGAAPSLALVSAQDVDGNGGIDRIVFEFSEPVAFTGRTGTSLSGYNPVTTTTALPIGGELLLRIAGETLTPIQIDGAGPQTTGAAIATRIQQAVRDYVTASAATLNRPAILNFTCTFTDGRYVLSAGVPVRFVGGTYVNDYSASTVEVLPAGGNDVAPLLLLGPTNGGLERPGAGDADTGLSASAGTGSYVPSTATLSLGRDGFTDFTITGTGLVGVANDLENQVRGATARSPACQPAYDRFCAVADTVNNRLVLVPGTTGSGSGVEVDSLSTFASTAIIGTASIPAGAIERVGQANTIISIDDLLIRSSTGANLMAGVDPGDVTVSGTTVTIDLANTPNSGTGSPTYLWRDLGDGGFLSDRAHLTIASGALTNLNAPTNIVIAGDSDGDGRLLVSQGQGVDPGTPTVDASGSVAFVGTAGVSAQYSWQFVSGPTTPLSLTTTGPVLQFQARTAGVYTFLLTIQALDAAGQPAPSALTDSLGRQQALVDVEIRELAPVASAGPDQVQVASVIQLDGSGSFDPNGGASIAYEWSAFSTGGVQLPSTVFSDAAAVQPTFTPGATGSFTVRLTVRKSPSDLFASDDMLATLIDSANLIPVADAGPTIVGRVNTEVTLDGSRSCDAENAPLTFSWTIVSSPQPTTLSGATTATPRFVPSVPGSYVLQLVVADGATTSLPVTTTVVVIDDATAQPRRAPGAVARAAGLRRAAFLVTPPADLRATTIALLLPDGTPRVVSLIDVATDATDDPTSSATVGLTQVRLISGTTVLGEVYALLQAGDEDPVSVTVGSETQPIVSYGVEGEAFTLDATRSQDDGLIQSFVWTWVSGPSQPFSSRDGSLIAVVPLTGAYVFDLVVTDAIGLSSLPARIVIPVVPANQPSSAPPSAKLSLVSGGTVAAGEGTETDPLVVSVDTNGSAAAPLQTGPAPLAAPAVVVLSASQTTYRGGATAGSFTWVQIAGPQAILSGQTTDTLSVTMKIEGAYAFLVGIEDSAGVVTYAQAWIVVGAEPPVARLSSTRRVPAGTTITLDGSGSTGPTGLTYEWAQLDGAPVVLAQQGSSATTSLDIPGSYRFSLRVASGGVTSAPATVRVRADGTADQQLASGATTSKSSGGCSLTPVDPPDSRSGAALAIVILSLLAARRRGRRSV